MKTGVISSRKPQEKILDILSRYRTFGSAPVGFTKASDAKAMKAVVEGYAYLPNDWVNNAMKGKVVYASIAAERAFFRHANIKTMEIAIPKRGSTVPIALHEWGHAMKDVPIVSALEHEFYVRRTLGFPVERLRNIYPLRGYDIHEKTRRDRFVDAYMGKFYGGRRYEIVSMGLEYVFFNRKRIWRKDPEYVKFILGLLLGGKV